jgi:hypothetical protein
MVRLALPASAPPEPVEPLSLTPSVNVAVAGGVSELAVYVRVLVPPAPKSALSADSVPLMTTLPVPLPETIDVPLLPTLAAITPE